MNAEQIISLIQEGVSASKPENCTLRLGCADPRLWGEE
jgi:hypothetical protein